MASRTYEVAFRISGALNGNFASAMQAAQNAMKGLSQAAAAVNSAMQRSSGALSGYLQRLNNIGKDSDKFASLQSAIPKTQADLATAINKTRTDAQNYQNAKSQVDQYRAALEKLQQQKKALQKNYEAEKSTLANLRVQLQTLQNAYKSNRTPALKSQIDSLKASISAQREIVRSAKADWESLKAGVKLAASELKSAEGNLKVLGSTFENSKNRVRELYNTLKSQKAQLESLKSSLNGAGFSTSNFLSSEIRLRSEIEATTRAIERQAQAAARLTSAQGNLNAASQNFSDAQNLYNNVTGAVQSVAQPIVDATQNAADFEFAMSKVKSTSQMRNIRAGNFAAVEEEMAALTQMAESLGATTEFTSTEVAQAMGKYAMSGWNKDQILAAMQATVDMASIAGDHNIIRTADVLSDDLMAFGLKPGQEYELASGKKVEAMSYFNDAFAYAWTNANLDRESLHEAWKLNAPSAKSAGLSLGEALAMNMFTANAGIKGSQGGTTFRAGWTRFLAPPKTAQKSLEEMGATASDATKQLMEAQAALQEAGIGVNDSLFDKITKAQAYYQTLDKEHRAGWLKNLVGMPALSGWTVAFEKGGMEEIARIAQEIDSGSIEGWANDTATVMRDNTATSIKVVQSAIDALQRSIGNALLPAVRSAADAIAPVILSMSQWASANPAVVQGIVGIIAVLGTLAVAVAGVTLAFAGWSFITAQVGMFTAGMAAVRSGMIATEVASLGMAARMGAAFASLRMFIAGLSFSSIAASISTAFASIGSAISAAFLPLLTNPVTWVILAIAAAAYVVYANWSKLGPIFSQIGNTISESLSRAGAAVSSLAGPISLLIGLLSPLGNLIKNAFANFNVSGLTDGVIAVILATVNTIAGLAVSIVNIFTATANSVVDIFSGLGEAIGAALDGEFSKAADKLSNSLDKVKSEWANFDILKGDFGYDIMGSFRQQYAQYKTYADVPTQAAVERHNAYRQPAQLPQPDLTAPQFDLPQVPAQQPVDVTPITQGVEQVGTALSQVPQAFEPIQNLPAQIEPVTTALQSFPESLTPVTEALSSFPESLTPVGEAFQNVTETCAAARENIQQVGEAAQAASETVKQLGESAGNAYPQIDALGSAAQNASGNVDALGVAAGNAAGNVDALGGAVQGVVTALQGAASAISSIKISAPTVVAAANYSGGIYNKGAFLTWFAEKSPEAAIPLDKSNRAINLWTQAGQMLGVLPGNSNVPVDKPKSSSTLSGVNKIFREKLQVARQVYEKIVGQKSVVEVPKVENSSVSEKLREFFSQTFQSVKQFFSVQNSVYKEVDGVKVYETREYQSLPRILTERQRYLSEDWTKERTLERVQNSRSYKALTKAKNTTNRTSNSIFNRGELNTRIATDLTGGLFGRIFGSDGGLGQIATSYKSPPPINIGSMTTSTFKLPQSQSPTLNTKIPTDISGGAISQIFGGDFGLGEIASSFESARQPSLMESTLSSVESRQNDYSAATFQPNFTINVTVNLQGENIDPQSVGEQIAASTRRSFEEEFERFLHERERRSFL